MKKEVIRTEKPANNVPWLYRFIVDTIICETRDKNLKRLFAEIVSLLNTSSCNSYQPVLFLTMVSANIDRTIQPCLTLILHPRLILDTVVYGFEHENRSNVRSLAACRLQTALITYWRYMYLEALYYPIDR